MTGTFLDRAAWRADPSLPRLGHVVRRSQFVGLVEHHTVIVMPDWDHDGIIDGDIDDIRRYMQHLQIARPDLGLDVPYSFVVFRGADEYDYVVCEGRGFDRTGAHTAGFNSSRYGVALAGDFTNTAPTIGMLVGVRWVGAQLDDPAGARPTLGHCDTKATACPGAMAYPLLDRVQPPFTPPSPPVHLQSLDMEAFLVATSAFQLIGDGGLVYTFVPGQRAITMGGLGNVHGTLNTSGVAPVAGNIPQGELNLFAERWDQAVA